MQGRSGITQIEKFDTDGYSTRFAGEIKQLDVSKYVNRKMARRLDDVIKYTIVAGKKVRLVPPSHPHQTQQLLGTQNTAHGCCNVFAYEHAFCKFTARGANDLCTLLLSAVFLYSAGDIDETRSTLTPLS